MSLFIETCENLQQTGSEQTESTLMLSSEDSPAKTLVVRVSELVSIIATGNLPEAAYGQNTPVSLATLSQNGLWLKMFGGSCQSLLWAEQGEDSELYSETWPIWGIVQDGVAMALPTLGLRSKGTGCSLWRTPSASDANHSVNSADSNGCLHLTAQVHWPTPTVPNGGRQPKGGMSLTGMTPDGKKRQVDLNYAVKNWPTPAAQDSKNATLPPSQKDRDTVPGAVMRSGKSGSLNAEWVEILMNYPVGWTDLTTDAQAWPGWPAPQGCEQYDYEPPRVIEKQPKRVSRLKCLGNSVVPLQPYPIFAAIMEVERDRAAAK